MSNPFDAFDTVAPEPLRLTVRPPGAVQAGPNPFDAFDAQPTSPGQNLAVGFLNQGSAAGQRTSPNTSVHAPNLISADVHQSDAGELLFRDQTGNLIPTDQNKHVVLRDPADNTLKVFGRTEATNEGRLSAGGRLLSTGMATGAPTLRPAVGLSSTKAPTSESLKAAAAAGYGSDEVAAVTLQASALEGLSQKLQAALNERGLDENVAPKVFGVLAKASKAPEGSVVTGRNLESLRRTLGHAAGSADASERLAARTAMEAVDDFLLNLPRADLIAGDAERAATTLASARGNYAAAKRSEQITGAEEAAQLSAQAANSGMNLDNATRQRIKSILLNPSARRGFSSEEIQQMAKIVRGTIPVNVSRRIGNLLGGGGGLGAAVVSGVSAAGGAAAAGPLGAMAGLSPVVGYAFKKLANSLTSAQVAKLDELVRSRSPLGRAAERSIQNWSEAAQKAAENPSGAKIGILMMTTRNLSNTLRGAGLEVSSQNLLRSLQTGGVGRAEDEQQ